MNLTVNHYASKDLNLLAIFGLEAVLTDFFLAFIGGVFAYIGYQGQIAILFFGCILVSVVYFIAGIGSFVEYCCSKNSKGKLFNNKDSPK